MSPRGGPAPAEAGLEAMPGGEAEGSLPSLRAFAFGGVDRDAWGIAWIPGRCEGAAVVGLQSRSATSAVVVEGLLAEEPWRAALGTSELVLEPASEPVWVHDAAPEQGFDQLCRISGNVQVGELRRGLSSLGWRSTRAQPVDSRGIGSLRQVAGWFESGDGFALLALRPRKAKGQEGDQITAVMFDPQQGRQVADPRLSTTYTATGSPVRAGVELWVQADSEQQFPRRALGKALQSPVELRLVGLTLQCAPFRWQAGSGDGAGIYVLGKSQ